MQSSLMYAISVSWGFFDGDFGELWKRNVFLIRFAFFVIEESNNISLVVLK